MLIWKVFLSACSHLGGRPIAAEQSLLAPPLRQHVDTQQGTNAALATAGGVAEPAAELAAAGLPAVLQRPAAVASDAVLRSPWYTERERMGVARLLLALPC